MISRTLDLKPILKNKSCFLFGPRQTGKTTPIELTFPNVPFIQLLDAQTQRALLANPTRLGEMIPVAEKIVIIDEVHYLIEKRKINFLLTGSNARRLKRSGVNLLGGRARKRFLYALTTEELGVNFNLEKDLSVGTLPSIYFSDNPKEDLQSYVAEYLTQEVASEGLTRNVPAFAND